MLRFHKKVVKHYKNVVQHCKNVIRHYRNVVLQYIKVVQHYKNVVQHWPTVNLQANFQNYGQRTSFFNRNFQITSINDKNFFCKCGDFFLVWCISFYYDLGFLMKKWPYEEILIKYFFVFFLTKSRNCGCRSMCLAYLAFFHYYHKFCHFYLCRVKKYVKKVEKVFKI